MNPITDLIDQETSVAVVFRGYDHVSESQVEIPVLVILEKASKRISVSVNLKDLTAVFDNKEKDITLSDTVFNHRNLSQTDVVASDADLSVRILRIRRRRKEFFEDGGFVQHLELTIHKGAEIIQALISLSQWQQGMKILLETIGKRNPTLIAA